MQLAVTPEGAGDDGKHFGASQEKAASATKAPSKIYGSSSRSRGTANGYKENQGQHPSRCTRVGSESRPGKGG